MQVKKSNTPNFANSSYSQKNPAQGSQYGSAQDLKNKGSQEMFQTNMLANLGGAGPLEFTDYRMGQAINTLQEGITEDEGDIGLRNQLRDAYSSYLGGVGREGAVEQDRVMADQERGLSRNLAQLRRQMGGTGAYGSAQSNRQLGEMLAGAQRGQGEALNQLSLRQGERLGQAGAGLGQVLGQSLSERGYQMNQAKSLSDLMMQQAAAKQGYYLGSLQPQGPSDFERGLGYLLQAGGTAAQAFGGK